MELEQDKVTVLIVVMTVLVELEAPVEDEVVVAKADAGVSNANDVPTMPDKRYDKSRRGCDRPFSLWNLNIPLSFL